MKVSDEERACIKECQEGNPDAFEALVTKYQRMIYSVAYRMSGSVEEAQDLTQETFLQAYRKLHSYRGEALFSSWLYRIAVNLTLNRIQENRRETSRQQQWGEETAIAESGTSIGSGVSAVQQALLKLPEKQRAAVVLTHFEEKSHAEAARILGCSETTISWRVFTARAKLKKLLKGKVG